jgi:hypothetical protein
MMSHGRYGDLVGDAVSKATERETGTIVLTRFTEEEEELVYDCWWAGNVPPRTCAAVLVALRVGRRRRASERVRNS